MNTTKEQVKSFLEKCDELKKCKFIMATTKIKDLLKCIVNNSELYKLFDTVTKDFNYPEQKAKCLVTVDDGYFKTRKVVLPSTVGQRLAFIFCLLVEFDRDSLNFNNFLQTYYSEDGSYFASYQAFCRTFIVSLEELIYQVFKAELEEPEERETIAAPVKSDSDKAHKLSAIEFSVNAEKQFISNCRISDEEKKNGLNILNQLITAAKFGDEELLDALICGYNYFILYNKCVSEDIAELIETLAEYEEML